MTFIHPSRLALAALLILLVLSLASDLRSRKVPNLLLVAASGVFLLLVAATQHPSWRVTLLGGALGLLVFLPFYFKSMMGAGDVKLMGVVGLCLGPKGVLASALLTALSGGVLVLAFFSFFKKSRVPYVVAIFLGCCEYLYLLYFKPSLLML